MLKSKLIKRPNSQIFTEINTNNDQANYKYKEQKKFNNLINNFFLAITEFYKVSSGNFQQILKLLSILEKQNLNYINNINIDEEIISQKNTLMNNIKLIITINNSNLNNFYRDSKIILNKIEIDRKSQNQKIIRSMSDNKRKIVMPKNNNNKTIDNNTFRHTINKIKFSTIDSFFLKQESNNNNLKGNKMINSLFKKLINFRQVIGTNSQKMENLYMNIINNIYNEYKKLEKENPENKIIKNSEIIKKNKTSRGNSFSKTSVNVYNSTIPEPVDNLGLVEKIKIYKVKNENYKNKIEELKCQLDSLKSYSNALEATLEDKYVNNNYYNYNITQNNEQNINKLKNAIKNNKNLVKALENLKELNNKLNEDNNRNISYLQKNEQVIKKLNLINNNLKNKLKEYENMILQENIKKVNILNNDKDNPNNLKIIQNIFFYIKSEFEKNNEIISLKSQILKLKDSNNNYNSLLKEKEKQINIQQNEIKELKKKYKSKNNNKIINAIQVNILGIKQKIEKENECEIKYQQKDKEIISLKEEYKKKINDLNAIIQNKNKLIDELKLIQSNNNDIDNDNSIVLQKQKLEEEIYQLKITNENLKKTNSELLEIKESNNIIEQKNKDIIRELNQDKLLLENELEDVKKKNDILTKEISESKNKFENESVRSNVNSSLKESYNKKVSKTHIELVKKVTKLENEMINKDQELDGLKKFIEKLQKEKEDIILNKNNINILGNTSNNEEKLIKENEKLKIQLEHLSSTFPKEMEELRKENEKLLNKYNNLKREKNNTAS